MLIEYQDLAKNIFDRILVITGVVALICFIFVIGFYLDNFWFNFFSILSKVTVGFFVLQEIIRWFFAVNFRTYLKSRIVENTIALLVLIQEVFPHTTLTLMSYLLPELSLTEFSLFFISTSQLAVLLSIFLRALRYNTLFSKIHLHAGSILVITFIFVILIGTFMLMLPRSVSQGKFIGFTDALFTSTSAVCVTGLVVVDTSSHFSGIGKLIIASLIQIGGLGLMTFSTFFAIMLAGTISLRVKVLMKDILSQDNLNEGIHLLKRIFLFTFVIEILGSFLLYFSLVSDYSYFDKEIFFKCLFHSISAFCNAGFSVYSDGLMFHSIQKNYLYLSIIMILIVLGGLGFFTINDVVRNIWKTKKRRLIKISSKIVIITTIFLILFGLFAFVVFESNSKIYEGTFDKIFHALFLSVTARTAGFNTTPIELLSPATIMVLIILMWIGASPGSTGGGIKTTTFAVTVITLMNFIRGKQRVEIFNREIYPENIRQSLMVIISSLLFLGAGTTLLVWIEPGKDPLDLIFEATSAISTVGLSRNLTFDLTDFSKYILIVLMFVGRIGVFTFFLSLHKPKAEPRFKLPTEKIMIG